MLLVQNYGVGPAIDCVVEIEPFDAGREKYPILSQRLPYEKNEGVSCIQPGDKASMSIHIEMNFDKIQAEDIVYNEEMPEQIRYSLTREASRKYRRFDIVMNFVYHDILHNEYVQKIKMSVNVYTSIKIDGTSAAYKCDLNLVDVADPVKR